MAQVHELCKSCNSAMKDIVVLLCVLCCVAVVVNTKVITNKEDKSSGNTIQDLSHLTSVEDMRSSLRSNGEDRSTAAAAHVSVMDEEDTDPDVYKVSADHGQKSAADTKHKRTYRSTKTVQERKISRQLKQLKKMKCQPILEKVFVREQLEEERQLLDHPLLIPEVLSVRRCVDKCSFCGGNKLGREDKTCVAINQTNTNFIIRYYNIHGQKKYYRLPIREDTECACV